MMEMIEANWWLIVLALFIGLATAWFIFRANRTTRVSRESGDVLDEGASPAARNQALIDSNPSATADGAARIAEKTTADTQRAETHPGAISAAADSDEVAAAPAVADAEAGDAVPAREAIKAAPPAPAAAARNSGDDLTRLKGVGPKLAAMLGDMGVTTLGQIAAWSDADIDRIDAQLGRFQGRIRRDDWVTQARLLAADDTAGYEAKFGRLD